MIGQQLDGKYEITSQLGSGAMGTVYEARNIHTGRTVAVKVISNGLGSDPALVARFQREARAAGAIDSQHIAQVLDAGQDRVTTSPYLVMELLKGEDLDTLLRHLGALRPQLALRIIAQSLSGLERAHASGVIHRDIKPANLFIARGDAGQRVVKLVDFGIAKVKDELAASNHALTQTSALLGSPLYMSPEQAKASKKVDGRADLWSLGVVLYQMLTGKAPHAHAESLTELLLAICTENVRPVQETAPWVPADVAMIVEAALRLDPNKRFATAKDMRDAIAAVVPDWNVLNDAMLTPMTPEERSFVAAPAEHNLTLGVSTGPQPSEPRAGFASSPAMGGATVLGPLPQSSSPDASSPPALAASGPGHTDTQGGTSGTLSGKPARRSLVLPIGLGVVVIGALGLVGLRTLSKHDDSPRPAASGLVAPPMTMPSAEPSPDPMKPDASVATSVPPPASSSSASTPASPATSQSATTRPRLIPPPSAKPLSPTAPPTTTAPATTTTPKPPPTPSSNISRDFN